MGASFEAMAGAGDQARAHAIMKTDTILKSLAGHIITLEQEMHFLRERLEYSTHSLGSRLGGHDSFSGGSTRMEWGEDADERTRQDENTPREAASTLQTLEVSVGESRSTLKMIAGHLEAVLSRCELQWDGVEDGAVYKDMRGQKAADRHWWESSRQGGLPGGTIKLASNKKGQAGFIRGMIQALVGLFSFSTFPSSSNPNPGGGRGGGAGAAPRGIEARLQSKAALTRSSGSGSTSPDGKGEAGSVWTFVLVVLVAVLMAALAWLWLRDKQRTAKKMA